MTKSKEPQFCYYSNGAISSSFKFSQTNPYVCHSIQEGSVLGLLLSTGSVAKTTPTAPTMASPMTRTVFKQQLQKQHLEQLEQQEKKNQSMVAASQESQSISIPSTVGVSSATNTAKLPHEVPTSVLQVNKVIKNVCF